ncbi:MAG: hypothetical protein H8D45_22780 [Bacteroidetes bacterium]|nr:hypothetical protein [Bacteroidota bacterium]MBL7105758.1 hypothetical protein [Bacteroidales bacterium]
MAEFKFTEYMLEIAEALKEILHTAGDKHFSRISSLPALEEYLQNMTFNSGWQILVVDNRTGRYDDSSKSDNLLDRQLYSFYLVKSIKLNDFDAREQLIRDAEIVLKKILSKYFYDKRSCLNGLRDLQRNSITYDTIGPIGNECHGLMVHFSIIEPPGIIYNEDDWSWP